MPLKSVVDNLDGIPEHFHELYTERNGKFEITGIEGMRTQGDIDRLQSALNKERTDHKGTKEKFAPLSNYDVNDVLQKLDRYSELEEAAKGKIDDAKLEELVGNRLKSRLAPVERERDTLRTQLEQTMQTVQQFQARETQRTIFDKVREAATSAKVLPEAMEDALLLAERVFEVTEDGRVVTKDNVGVTPGIEANVWLTELQTKRPHWWAPSSGGGAQGNRSGAGGGTNPWSHDHWNMTEQGRILSQDRSRAEQLAKSAGTTIGGPRPTPRK